MPRRFNLALSTKSTEGEPCRNVRCTNRHSFSAQAGADASPRPAATANMALDRFSNLIARRRDRRTFACLRRR
jgi:hypothetical protein